MPRVPLTRRPVDFIFFIFFFIHIPMTICIDLQPFYPPHIVPEALKGFLMWFLEYSGDPLVSGAMGLHGAPGEYAWLRSFFMLEGFFQLPTFFISLWGLWNASATIDVLILIYGASTATTTLPCVATILAVPTTTDLTIKAGITSLTDFQRYFLLANYLPFVFVPLWMTIDRGLRTLKLVKAATRLTKKMEAKSH